MLFSGYVSHQANCCGLPLEQSTPVPSCSTEVLPQPSSPIQNPTIPFEVQVTFGSTQFDATEV